MRDRDKSILEEPEKMCEYCCNFDKEHIGMDCTAHCKLTMTLAYAEDYGGNCMFYNVPKEQIIVPPIKMKQKVWAIAPTGKLNEYIINGIHQFEDKHFMFGAYRIRENGRKVNPTWQDSEIGKTVFLTKEEAEAKLKEREG